MVNNLWATTWPRYIQSIVIMRSIIKGLYYTSQIQESNVGDYFRSGYLFVCFVALRPKSTVMVMARRSFHLTTLFPGQAWTRSKPVLRAHTFACNWQLRMTVEIISHSISTKVWGHGRIELATPGSAVRLANQISMCLDPLWSTSELRVRLGLLNQFKPSSKSIFYWPFQGSASFVDRFCWLCFMSVCVVLCSLVVTCWERADLLAVMCVVLSISQMCPGPHQNQGWGWRRETGLSPPVKYFTDRSKAVLLLWIFYVFVLSCVCYVFVRVCLYVLWGHLLGKGWPLGSRLWCLLWVCHFPIGILGQVWYLIVSIPDLCTLTYFASVARHITNCPTRPGVRLLALQSDSHLLPDTLSTALCGPVNTPGCVAQLVMCLTRPGEHMGLCSPVGNLSGKRCESDCRSRGPKFNPSPVPYFLFESR